MAETHHTPPAAVRKAAQKGLDMRATHKRGGIGPGQARARQLVSGKPMPVATVKRMHSYFSRHEVDKQGTDFHNSEKPSNGRIAWELWGGDAGQKWARSVVGKEAAEVAGGTADTTYTLGVNDSDGSLWNILSYLKKCGSDGHSVSFSIDDQKFGFDGDGSDKILTLEKAAGETAGTTTYTLGVRDGDQQLSELLAYLKQHSDAGNIALIEVSGDHRTRRFVWNGQAGAQITSIATQVDPATRVLTAVDRFRARLQEAAAVEPRPLYVCRYLLPECATQLAEWAKENGFPALEESELHVTLVYSKGAVNWMKCGAAYGQSLYVPPGGPRSLERFGPEGDEKVIVLCFLNDELRYRQEQLLKAGCTSDWPDYQPHMTLCQDPDHKIDIRALKAYQGELVFGPETFSDIQEDAGTKVTAHLERLRAKVRG